MRISLGTRRYLTYVIRKEPNKASLLTSSVVDTVEFKNMVLEDSTNPGDFQAKLKSLQDEWDRPCPGFHKLFCKKQKPFLCRA